MKLLFVLGWLLAPLVPIGLFFATGSFDVAPLAVVAKVVGIASFTWLCGQLFLAAKPWGLDKLLGTRLLYSLHGVLAFLGALLGGAHFAIKSGVLGVTPSLQTLPGFVALLIFDLTVIGSLFLMSGAALPKVRWLAGVRKWAQDTLKITYARSRMLHNTAAVAVLLLGVHVLAASTTLHSWVTTVWMALWFAGCYGLFVAYRLRGRKPVGSA